MSMLDLLRPTMAGRVRYINYHIIVVCNVRQLYPCLRQIHPRILIFISASTLVTGSWLIQYTHYWLWMTGRESILVNVVYQIICLITLECASESGNFLIDGTKHCNKNQVLSLKHPCSLSSVKNVNLKWRRSRIRLWWEIYVYMGNSTMEICTQRWSRTNPCRTNA